MKKDLNYYLSLNYLMEIIKIPDSEGGGYSASIPQLGKYAFVGDGDTIEEAVNMLGEVKEFYFKKDLSAGVPIPEPIVDNLEQYSGKINIRMPKELHRTLKRQADKNNVSLNQWMIYCLSSKNVLEEVQLCKEELINTVESSIHSSFYNKNKFYQEELSLVSDNYSNYDIAIGA
jgi:antitoxin HicB